MRQPPQALRLRVWLPHRWQIVRPQQLGQHSRIHFVRLDLGLGDGPRAQRNGDLNNDSNRATDRTPGLGRNTFSLPRNIELDLRVAKNINLTEGYRIQLIAEAFNLFNHTNINNILRNQFTLAFSGCSSVGTPCLKPVSSFKSPTGDLGARVAQLAAKFTF